MSHYPKKVLITEVGPRDGLQNEQGEVPTAAKIALVNHLVESGLSRIEVTSFVSPKWVPQMADAAEVYQGISKKPGVKYIALTPNQKGYEKALECEVNAIAVFTAASESFTKKNINVSIAESIENFREIVGDARQKNIWVRGYVSTCFACPYEGEVKPEQVLSVAEKLLGQGIDELSLGDTIGMATPKQVEQLLNLILKYCPSEKIALHFHDTRGTALANVLMGLQMGISHFDSSNGGLGGCPYAPGASGNLATEDLLYLLHGMEIEAGVDLDKVVAASRQISKILGRSLPSKYLQACGVS